MTRVHLYRLVWLVGLLPAMGAQGQATGWRGDGSGRWPDANAPTAWDGESGKNVLWRATVGKGQSSPVVVGDRILVTAEPDKLICVDGRDGSIVWERANDFDALPLGGAKAPAKLPPTTAGCGYAAATPVSDGKSVYASFGTGIVACYDLAGERRWIRHVDAPQPTQYGRSASPLLAGGKLLIGLAHLTALDPQTGKVVWETAQAEPAYGTPALARIGGVEVALTPAGACVRVSDGKVLATKLGEAAYSSPVVEGGVAYYATFPAVAVKLPEQAAEAFKPAHLWTSDDVEGSFYASPLVHEGRLFFVSNEGTLYCVDAATGKAVYTKDLPIRNARGDGEAANLYPSLTLAGKQIVVSNDVGEAVVVDGGKQYKEIAVNRLGKGSGACPVASGQRLLLRGGDVLYCISAPR